MSDNELNLMDIPAIGDELYTKEADGKPSWTLLKIKEQVQGCMKPPKYKGANTPVTKRLEKQIKANQANHSKNDCNERKEGKQEKSTKYESKKLDSRTRTPRQQYAQTGDKN